MPAIGHGSSPAVPHVRQLIARRDLSALAATVRALTPEQVRNLFADLDADEAAVVFRLLHKNEATAVFEAMDPREQAAVIFELGERTLADVFTAMDPEDQAWLLDELPAKVASKIIAACRPEALESALELLGYAVGSVGRRMSPATLRGMAEEPADALVERILASTLDATMVSVIPVVGPDRRLVRLRGPDGVAAR